MGRPSVVVLDPSAELLIRSCVIGRGVEILSSSSAMALASKRPTQIGRERFSSSSRRMIMGMLESRSSANPLTFIYSHIVLLLILVQLEAAPSDSRLS